MTKKLTQLASGALLMLSVAQLRLDPDNARKTGDNKPADDMIASIRDKGLLQPLSVIPHADEKNVFITKIGNRRLRALQFLVEDGTIDGDAKIIRCQPLEGTETQILEAQISENMIRQAMNPVDEFEAFAKLAEQGATPEEISVRFGTPLRTITKRMALGRCAQEVRDALRAGDVTIDAATAYAGCPDQDRQVRILNLYRDRRYGGTTYHEVRNALKEERIATDDAVAVFIDQEEYVKRGGEIEHDLIEEHGIMLNSELVYQLRDERLKAEMESYADDGWKFVEVQESGTYLYDTYRRIYGEISPLSEEETEQLAKAEEKLQTLSKEVQDSGEDWTDEQIEKADALEAVIDAFNERDDIYSDEQKATAGVILSQSSSGKLNVELGMRRLTDIKAEQNGGDSDGSGATNDNPTPKARFSQSLASDLGTYRGLGIAAALVDNPELAYDYMIFCNLYSAYGRGVGTGSSIVCRNENLEFNLTGYDQLPAAKALAKASKKLKTEIFEGFDMKEAWALFKKLTKLQRSNLIAHAVAMTITSPRLSNTFATEVVAAADVSIRDYWTPTFENYFSRIRKDQIFEHIVELVGEQTAITITNSMSLKKKDAATLAADIVSGKYPTTGRQEIIDAWVPQDMEFVKPAPKRSKKSAPNAAKKTATKKAETAAVKEAA